MMLIARYEERDDALTPDKKSYRAVIRFAPGPYGEVFTDWYTKWTDVDVVVAQLCERLADKEARESHPAHIKLRDTVRLPDGHLATVVEVGFTDLASGNPVPFVAVHPEGNWCTRMKYLLAGMIHWYGEDIDRLTPVTPKELRDIEERLDF